MQQRISVYYNAIMQNYLLSVRYNSNIATLWTEVFNGVCHWDCTIKLFALVTFAVQARVKK